MKEIIYSRDKSGGSRIALALATSALTVCAMVLARGEYALTTSKLMFPFNSCVATSRTCKANSFTVVGGSQSGLEELDGFVEVKDVCWDELAFSVEVAVFPNFVLFRVFALVALDAFDMFSPANWVAPIVLHVALYTRTGFRSFVRTTTIGARVCGFTLTAYVLRISDSSLGFQAAPYLC